jgi:Family of unknown function (DUF6152)
MKRPIPLLATLLFATTAQAHHSFAMFDVEKEITLAGTVKEFQWTNPHAWIQLNVVDEQGKTVEWGLESRSPNVLARQGFKSTILKPGDKITVVFNPLKDGKKGGSLVSLTMADGKKLPQVQPVPESQ